MSTDCRVAESDAGEPDPRVFRDPRMVAACFEDLPACVFVFEGPDHVFAAVNRAGRALLSPTRRVIGLPYREALPEVAGQRLVDLLDRAYTSGRPVSGREWRVLLDTEGDGRLREFYLDFTVVPTRPGADAVRGVVWHAMDVTDVVAARRAAEAQATAFEQRYQAALDVVMALQRSLLPERLPVLPGVGMAARYLVADSEQGAGGDWFDAVPLGDGRVGLVVGDVVGSGTRASAVMGQLRAVLMELFLDGCELPEVLARLDRFVARVPGAVASTVCVALLDPAEGRLDYACCGHPPPLVLAADGQVRYLPVEPGGPLGVAAATTATPVQTVWLKAGDVALLYTDGLVERPDRPLQQGLDLLRIVADDARTQGTPPMMAATVPDRVCELTVERMTRDGHTDDVTLLAVQWTGARPTPFHADLPAFPGALAPLRARLDDWLVSLGGSDDDVHAVRFAVLEALSNVIEHAYPDDAGSVRVEGVLDATGRICMTVADVGRWAVPPPHPGNRGRGLALIRACMDTVEIDSSATGTTVLMDRALSHLPAVGPDRAGPRPAVAFGEDGFRVELIEAGSPQVAVRGPIDLCTVTELHQRLQEAGRGGALPLTIDLSGVTHLASAGVQLLYQLTEQMAADGRRLQLVAPAGTAAHQVLALTALNQLADIVETPEGLPR
ncbi:SpoIIE family protein phosphatase [Pseudonocardia bannensis]|uniref:SpoIIE family protein phosphatase n=1 Tax=Pseudonocardia bannensis TaxID=630973 RepID=A0A848DH08_9PSEU|nr:SpoIIE family protein phosphatase [Pseudonocardia bannensis]NMH91962.1 SpoIIE family protein phosphatase [Pseudonocardia bannensis]